MQFVHILRNCTVDTNNAEIDLNLVGSSTRARTTIQEFQPQRTKGVAFSLALQTTEELTNLGAAKIKSLHFFLSAEGFRWKGSINPSSGKIAVLDAKSFQRKQRFHLSAHLFFDALDPQEPSIQKMLVEIANETGIHFEKEASVVAVQQKEPGRATPEQLLVTCLAWSELIETVEKRVRDGISLEGVPHLMTTRQAHDFLFDPAKYGKSFRVDFSRIVRKWLKEEFPNYDRVQHFSDGESLHKELVEGVITTLRIDKRPRAFSKEFTVWLGVALTSRRFAPTPGQPFELSVNLFHLFGLWPLPMQWTYQTEADLREALGACALLVNRVLAIFEHEAVNFQHAYQRSLGEFAGPRQLSAREAYELALPAAKVQAEDAALIQINSRSISGPYLNSFHVILPTLDGEGRLATNGAWHLRFHSLKWQENLHVTVPCRGSITITRVEAPSGRQWPSFRDQILQDGWIDSVEALRVAKTKAQDVLGPCGSTEIQWFELASRANVLATGIILPPRDGMFKMEANWRISFSLANETARSIAVISVPAYSDAQPTAEVHSYDKHGRPVRL